MKHNLNMFVEFTYGDRVWLTALVRFEETFVYKDKSGKEKKFNGTRITPLMFSGAIETIKIFDEIGMVQYHIKTDGAGNSLMANIHISAQQSTLYEWGKSYELIRMIRM